MANQENLTEKTCRGCDNIYPISHFRLRSRKNLDLGRSAECRACLTAKNKKWGSENPDLRDAMHKRWRDANPDKLKIYKRQKVLKSYNITEEIFLKMLEEQDYCCAVCRTPEPGGHGNQWAIDHDHSCCSGYGSCGKCIRGLLCIHCNRGLGCFKDTPALLNAAIEYLQTKDS